MKRLLFILLLVLLGSGIVSCSTYATTVTELSTTITMTTTAVVTETVPDRFEASSPISVTSINISGSWSIFSGDTIFPDGTILHSQLYEDDLALSWWPTTKDILVSNNEWALTVPFGENGAPSSLSKGPGYYFKIWTEDDPNVFGVAVFDFVEPPVPTLNTYSMKGQ